MAEALFDAGGAGAASVKVARVAVDVGLPHLDYLFDYAVPTRLDDDARPGVRVRVRFAGQLVDGWLVERADQASYEGHLTPLSKVVSPEPVLTSAQATLFRAVADHYAGTFCDVARLAIPPRHATTEKAPQRDWPAPAESSISDAGIASLRNGPEFLARLGAGESPRAFWQIPAASDVVVPAWIADAVAATLASGRGVIVVVPDARDMERTRAGLAERFGAGCVALLHADLGQSARYRNYLAVSRGVSRLVVGTRPAVYAPMRDLGLIVVLDEGSDLLADPHSPYPHARDVAAIRASLESCGLLLASHARSAEAQAWVQRGWIAELGLDAGEQRRRAPLVRVTADSDLALERDPLARQSRLPRLAFETIRDGLIQGPVLVQVPRAGYLASLACARCRTTVRCVACHGPVGADRSMGMTTLRCRWCGTVQPPFHCPTCGATQLRAPVVGSTRTAEELGRAFPGYRLVDSSGSRVVDEVSDQPAVVVATPGGEPHAADGYAAAVLLDAHLLLGREDLRASEETLRRWLNAVALVRPGSRGGTVCVVGPSDDRTVQALVRMDPAGLASRELAERAEAGFPPAWTLATARGDRGAVDAFRQALQVPDGAEVLGPIPVEEPPGEEAWRLIVRAPARERAAMVRAVKDALGVRSARKDPGMLRLQIDG